MINLIIIFVVIILTSCSYINKKLGLSDDNILEQTAEFIIEEETGIDVDLSP